MNRLFSETSPYLRQHAENPVDWFPWGEEALALSQEMDKPILLSIGYSACHWCHVMAHECFEDQEIAKLMNGFFVNIKVDREERPDLDQIYQAAHGVLTGRNGGWPLTLFLTPDAIPYFGGTYFPKEPAYGLPGFRQILPRIAAAYRESREDVERHALALRASLRNAVPGPASTAMSSAPIQAALESLEKSFDWHFGGFGNAPKFPNPAMLDLCLNHPSHRKLALFTLEKMAQGGIHDQLGGGFCRYSVDEAWNIPHFEKMLYDNAMLIRLYADAWCLTKHPLYLDTALGIARWAKREMQAPSGGYYASLDADSEGEEGKYYRWTVDEIASLLDDEEFIAAKRHFGLDRPPNFEQFHHLYEARSVQEVSAEMGKDCHGLLESAKKKLLDAREKRTRPARDEKILTSWNALMIGGMAHAARIFDDETLLSSARAALHFLKDNLWHDGRLFATCGWGQAKYNAYLDDYAFLLDALIEMLQSGFLKDDLDFAMKIADALIALFEDEAEGGFYFTSRDHESLILRLKTVEDGAMPSGNAMAMISLRRLGHILGETRYLEASQRAVKRHLAAISPSPAAHCSLVKALTEALAPPAVVVLTGQDAGKWHRSLSARHLGSILLAVPAPLPGLPQTLRKPPGNGTSAWVCRGFECLPPIGDFEALLSAL